MNVTRVDRCDCGHAAEACPRRRLNLLLALLPYCNEAAWKQLSDTERTLLRRLRDAIGTIPSEAELYQVEQLAARLRAA